jgi:ribosomal protein L4
MYNEEKLKSIFSDKDFVKDLISKKTPEEAKNALKQKGIELDEKDLKEIGHFLAKNIKSSNKKLNEPELAEVSGGKNAVLRIVGKTIAFPFATLGYTVGAVIAGLPKGMYDGFSETWWDEDESAKSK